MARRIVITSGKGGVGKTTTAYLLGCSLARLGHKTLVIDMDIGLNNLDLVAGIDLEVNFDLCDILERKCRVRQAIVQSRNSPLLNFLPCVNIVNSSKITTAVLQEIITELNKNYDYILIDCPAGIGFEFRRAIFYANEALIVTTPHLIAIRDAGRVANLLSGGIENVSLVLNRVKHEHIVRKTMYSPREIANSLRLKLSGVIRDNDSVATLSTTIGGLLNLGEDELSDWIDLAKNIESNRSYIFGDKKQNFV